MFKRIFLFLLVNILVVTTVSITLSMLGVHGYMNAYGIDYQQLAIFCLVWGMAGSLISLALSRFMAKRMMGVEVIDPATRDPELRQLVETVYELSRAAGLPKMPEVGVYDSPDLNAFATGPTKSRALVAVSTGLLGRMNKSEVEGVLGHEIAHVANGDMITLTLIQGVVNAFVMFLSRVAAFAITQALRGNSDREERSSNSSPILQHVLVIVFDIVFSILGSMVVAWFSRYREFRADAGGARFAGRDKMISALKALQRVYESPMMDDLPPAPDAIKAFQISSRKKGGFLAMFSTHPALEDRIHALENARSL
jgi:heat shock protein HtpX